jgi:hypothetical protein
LLFNCIRSDRGIALVAAMGISLIVMAATIGIAINSGFFSRTTKTTEEVDQLRFVSDFGLENYRYYLWDQWCPPPTWCYSETDVNGTTQEIPQNQYVSVMWNLRNSNMFPEQEIPISNTYSIKHHIFKNDTLNIVKGHMHFLKNGVYTDGGNYDYRVFAKKGPNPETLYVVSTAMKRRKVSDVSLPVERFEKRGSIEAALHFSLPCAEDYKQFGQCPSKTGETGEMGIDTTLRGSF